MIKTFLRRLYDYQDSEYHNGGLQISSRKDYAERVVAVLGSDNLELKTRSGYSPTIRSKVRPSTEECLAEFQWDTAASNELGLYIMLTGEYNNYYGRYEGKTMEAFIDLLDDDPINWSASLPPDSHEWYEFAGTFADSDISTSMLSLKFACGDDWPEYNFGIEMPTIADILKASSGFFLDRLGD